MKSLMLAALVWSCPAWSAPRSEARTVFQSVTVKRGDTLWAISNSYLKDPTQWSEIVKYNPSLSSDPTVALPGMVLKVPVYLIKESKRAAYVIEKINQVSFRRSETPNWETALLNMSVYPGDYLRTLEKASARVKFVDESLLSLGPDSMVMIKPKDVEADARLVRGDVFAGSVRTITPSARISPRTKDTEYAAKVDDILNTLVEVYTGAASVEAQGVTIDVKAGMSTFVRNGLAPGPPFRAADMEGLRMRSAQMHGLKPQFSVAANAPELGGAAGTAGDAAAAQPGKGADVEDLSVDMKNLAVGVPIMGYHVQASKTADFGKILLDKHFEVEEKIDFADTLPAGAYWFRVALIDLLGVEEKFTRPRLYSIGVQTPSQKLDLTQAMVITKPAIDGEKSYLPTYKVEGQVKLYDLTVTVNGHAARQDEDGNYAADVPLKAGDNDITITVRDSAGASVDTVRRVIYVPPTQQ